MSSKYKFHDKEAMYFITGTIVEWVDVFTRNIYKDILLDSIRYCQTNQGLQVHGWVIMTNHFHMICSFINHNDPGLVIKNIKSFTAMKIIDAIINNPQESRRSWLLEIFERNGRNNKSNLKYQFWQHENHPVILDTNEMYDRRFDYLHDNPVRAGFVSEPHEWLYSSAIDYATNRKGLLKLFK